MPSEPDATRIVTVFESVVDLPPEERARFLDRECAGDAALRAEVESLLAHLREAPTSGAGEASRRGSREDARPHDPARAPPVPRGTLLGRYVVLERLGAGGMGVVHRAYDTVLDRAVALKLLPSHGGWRSGPPRTQLLQEAQAMARLTHPHVVGVFDAGEVDGQVFIAMELVEGTTLRGWLQASARGWREVVEVFTAAGRGLAAAHAVGLVHRDFKPSNVLVGRDGRVRVTDFGLARAATGEPPPGAAPGLLDRAPPGLAVGTLAYMAPEQFAGGAVDARADLFSFCVAFWEALHGELPFPGESAAERLSHAREGRLRPPPPSTRVPPGVHRVLARGLRAHPTARPDSLDALLEELARALPTSRRTWAWAAAAGALLTAGAGLAVGTLSREPAPLCQGSEAGLAGIWDPARKAEVQRALLATGRPYAQDAWTRVEHTLDTYARRWAGMHHDACAATRLRGEQTEELLERRMACLDRRRRGLGALVDVLAHADATVVEKAAQAADALEPVDGCADLPALLAPVRPPDAPVREQVEAQRTRLARARALEATGQVREWTALTADVLREAEALGYKALLAEARLVEGRLFFETQELRRAAESLERAVWLGVAAGDSRVAAEAAARLCLTYVELGTWEDVARWDARARALLEPLEGDTLVPRALLLRAEGARLVYQQRYAQSLEPLRQALQLLRARLGEEHLSTLEVEGDYLSMLSRVGRYEESLAGFEVAARRAERLFGARHPLVAEALRGLAMLRLERGDAHLAEPLAERAHDILREAHGEDSPALFYVLGLRGELLAARGRHQEALAFYDEALAIAARAFGEAHPFWVTARAAWIRAQLALGRTRAAAQALDALGARMERQGGSEQPDFLTVLLLRASLATHRGHPAAALALSQEALRRCERLLEPGHRRCMSARFSVGRSLRETGRASRAREVLEALVGDVERHVGRRALSLLPVLLELGAALLDSGHPARARAPVERALEQVESGELNPNDGAWARFLLARVRAEADGDLEGALALAARARATFDAAPHPDRVRSGLLEAWRKQVSRRAGDLRLP